MMKHVAFVSATVALLVLSGCSSKEPAIDATANQGTTAQGSTSASTGSTVGTDSNAVIAPVTNANATDAATSGTNGSDAALQTIYFDFDKFNIRPDMEESMKTNSAHVKGKNIKLEGNCDEFGSDEYNYALGLRRANTVKTALINDGANADSITMVSFGESNPVCTEKTEECWGKNRRVDFKLP